MPRAIALFSGGLDSTLAVRVMQEQGFEVEALNVRTVLRCCHAPAAEAAARLGVRLHIVPVGDDYLEIIRQPRHGYGKGVNPCVDCRIYMARLARRWMDELGATLVISGEVLGQREMSQKRVDLDRIAQQSGLADRLLRPLSAQLLAPTLAEREGLVDRSKLYAFNGRGRRPLIELATRLGVECVPSPSPGCPLAEVGFAPRVRDLLEHQPTATRWEFELLAVGRHFRVADGKIVVGRNAEQNAALESFWSRKDAPEAALWVPRSFNGPSALAIGPATPELARWTAALLLRYAKIAGPAEAEVRRAEGASQLVAIEPSEEGARLSPL
jgi:hypothetical protein